MRKYDFLPQRLTKEEIALAPSNWVKTLSHYRYRRRRALWEAKPSYDTLLAAAMATIAKRDRSIIDIAKELTKDNIPKYIYFSLLSSALRGLGEKEESLRLIRKAVELDQSPATLLSLAADTDDLDEKENLAKKVLKKIQMMLKPLVTLLQKIQIKLRLSGMLHMLNILRVKEKRH